MQIAKSFWSIWILPLVILAIPAAIFASLVSKKNDLKPAELSEILNRIADETFNDDEWDSFESVPLENARLEAIRLRALAFCGRPGLIDGNSLRRLAAETRTIS